MFQMLCKIILESYANLTEGYQKKIMRNLTSASKSLKKIVMKLSSPDAKIDYVKKITISILKDININSITTFRAIFE